VDYANLGRTGLKVSRLCLGTMNFGAQAEEAESHAIMDRACELGINFFDTANVYGGRSGKGATEEIVGRWLADDPARRERIVLATKVYGRMSDRPNDARLSAYHIRAAALESLRRLRTDRIDLYQMHHIDRATPWEEIWQAMEQLVSQGRVLYAGSSNFAGWQIACAQGAAERRSFLGLVSEQSLYNLTARMVELEVLPCCRELGLGLLPWSPLSDGLLAGPAGDSATGRRAGSSVARRRERFREPLARYEALCRDLGLAPAVVALSWLLAQPGVASVIIGPRTIEQLEESMRALEVSLEDEVRRRLDEIWPGPGGPAPEAYAW
jgi:aryl-alcohol dehydrogenase-like predicted oxidoreductase